VTPETVAQFVTRLRSAAKDCEFKTDSDNQIRDAVLSRCASDYVKRKLLEEGGSLNLVKTLQVANQCELVETQMATMSGVKQETVHRVEEKNSKFGRTEKNKKQWSRQSRQSNSRDGKLCYRCGGANHFGRDACCPARGQTCRKCKGRDHFAKVCKSKVETAKSHVNQVGEARTDETEYAFTIMGDRNNMITIAVGGVDLEMLVDSGATNNIIDENTWESLKKQRINCVSKATPGKMLYAYASDKPIAVKGSATCEFSVSEQAARAELIVIKGKGIPLLGRETAVKLGVLKIGVDVAAVADISQEIESEYPDLFQGVGKLKTKQITLYIDPSVKPVAQPLRRTPFNLRNKVEDKINELVALDIIEAVDGPTPWVNPVVVVPKANNEIRLCIDMRRANEAIIRGRHPIPTVDDILQDMNGSTTFSKLDLKWGYHQLELAPESREITTFVTHAGLYRYKRLLFGVSSASEQYQHEIATVLTGIEGVQNISDDIIVHGKDQATHDERLHAAMKRLRECGLTLNRKKCQFNMDRLVFMGILLSQKGIGPTEERVKAVTEAREPETMAEVRSFLGLVGFSSRFIPEFATLSEPLRKLTRNDVPFEFWPEQKAAFKALKDSLAKANTLAYFDKTAPTKVIADAGPVGIGAVLVQHQKDGLVPVCYASRCLTSCERRYSQTEREALSLVWACEKFHVYIYGMQFELVTDHKPLEVIYGPRSKPSARIERWVLRLQPYDYKVIHIPGRKNIADSLSRLMCKGQSSSNHIDDTDEYVRLIAVSATPKALTTRQVEEASESDDELRSVRDAIQTGRFEKCKTFMHVASELCAIGQLVLRGTRIVIPQKLRPQVLALAHEGHLGVVGTKSNLRSRVWWPGIDKAAERYCRTCHGCQLVARPDHPEPVRSTVLPDGPWQDLAIDILGPFPTGHSVLVIVDYYSRYYEYDILTVTTAEKIIDCLEDAFSRHGLPVTIKSDNGPQFRSDEFREYCDNNDITHLKVTAKWAPANGEVERQNASLMKIIRIAQAEGLNWRNELRKYVAKYRAIPHATTGKSPAELLFKRQIRGKLPEFKADNTSDLKVHDRDAEQKEDE